MMKEMKALIGLGNPGKKYTNTRHNIGFELIDKIQREYNFPDFKFDKKFDSLVSKKGDLFIMKPQTFMNRSGMAVRALKDYYNIDSKDLLIIHDDADIDLGKVKIDFSRSSGGHKGVQSIIDHLKTKNFWRIRFGISKDEKEKAINITLKKFSKKERETIEPLTDKLLKEIEEGLKEGFEKKSILYKKN